MLQQWHQLLIGVPQSAFHLGVLLLVLMLVFMPLERRSAKRRQVPALGFTRPAFEQDLAYYFLGGIALAFLLIPGMALWRHGAALYLPRAWLELVANAPLWLRIPLLMVVGDVGYYWAHRLTHEMPWLWRFHAIHHSPTQVNWLVNTRAHPFDLAISRIIAAAPGILLGLSLTAADNAQINIVIVAANNLFGTLWAFVIHLNCRWRLGWLEQVVSTPAFHHWHHANEGPASINKNYAALFPWIDRLFGTLLLPARYPERYGTETAVADSLGAQLGRPFLKAWPTRSSKDEA